MLSVIRRRAKDFRGYLLILVYILSFIVTVPSSFAQQNDDAKDTVHYKADIIVYGGTSGAVTAAVQAARMDKSVIMISPDTHLGGLSSGGLGFTDTGNKEVIGGLSREFYQRVYNYYQQEETWRWQDSSEYGNQGQGTTAMDEEHGTMWIFEPHIAEAVFEDFIAEEEITVLRDEWLDRKEGVHVKNGRIHTIETLSGKEFSGQMFIDGTYEGDLMAAAGVEYHVGREANSVYNAAASLAIDGNTSVQDVEYQELRKQLLDDGQILEYK